MFQIFFIMKLISTAFFPNIEYFSEIINEKLVEIEQYENFPKQTYRNRCYITTDKGKMPLIVMLEKSRGGKTHTKDIKISYAEDWQKKHFHTIKSAYSLSPFFDFFMPEIEHFFQKKYKYLLDLNTQVLENLCDLLGVDVKIKFTEDFVPLENNYCDLRFYISPKIKSKKTFEEYIQVFSDRTAFEPNLSILDLLFNLGSESLAYLKRII